MRKSEKMIEALDFEKMTEDEIDEYYRPRKANSSKQLVALYVYLILKEEKRGCHMTQVELRKRLGREPYCINIERQALSRVLHLLDEGSALGIVCTSDDGCWYDEEMDIIAGKYV